MKAYIDYKIISMNKYDSQGRTNKHIQAKTKKEKTNQAKFRFRNQIKLGNLHKVKQGRVRIKYTWYVMPNRGKYSDPDNIAFNKKFINDALTEKLGCAIIKDDSFKCVAGFDGDDFVLNSGKEGVEIQITEIKED